MIRLCECGGRMNRFRFPVIRRTDAFGRQLYVFKCIECGNEETFPI